MGYANYLIDQDNLDDEVRRKERIARNKAIAKRTRIPVLRRVYNENEYVREGRNGRLYRGILGWRWYAYCGEELVGNPEGYRTRSEAHADAKRILNP